jgi:hypothetical protein
MIYSHIYIYIHIHILINISHIYLININKKIKNILKVLTSCNKYNYKYIYI